MSVVQDITNYISTNGGPYSSWYAGIASDPRQRLFFDHNVSEHGGAWIYRDAGTAQQARASEQHLHRLGCKGGPGGGDHATRFAYAYKITAQTLE